ncbi:MAG: FKBP-type peptidyl-prolyl cis-trans isomerase [Thermodesulfobacteriota bacterium]
MIRRFLVLMICVAGLVLPATAGEKKMPKTENEKLSYAMGVNAARGMKRFMQMQSVELDMKLVESGFQDGLQDGEALLKDQEIQDILTAFQKEMHSKQQKMMAAQQEQMKTLGEKNKKEGDKFLAENKNQKGVKTLPSGLQYKIIKEGTGAAPKETDKVTVHYQGTLIDGTEFDSSYKRGTPVTFPVNGVIKGWTEALKLMKTGSKWKLFIPSGLAYGEGGTPGGPIGPNAVLLFEVELISVQK